MLNLVSGRIDAVDLDNALRVATGQMLSLVVKRRVQLQLIRRQKTYDHALQSGVVRHNGLLLGNWFLLALKSHLKKLSYHFDYTPTSWGFGVLGYGSTCKM